MLASNMCSKVAGKHENKLAGWQAFMLAGMTASKPDGLLASWPASKKAGQQECRLAKPLISFEKLLTQLLDCVTDRAWILLLE
jgi:hypothetical protein